MNRVEGANIGLKNNSAPFPGKMWNKVVALLAVANLLLVLFNLSYIPLRDIYLRQIPALVALYDPIKSIEAHPDTSRYLKTVDALTQQLPKVGLQAPATTELFSFLRQQSTEMLAENPFSVANKFGTFAKLKRRIEHHLDTQSAKEAFNQFWSQDYFTKVSPPEALGFFDSKIRPLLEVNYYRSVDENGQFIDDFWRIDLYFMVFFGLEFLLRSFWKSRQREDLTWGDALLRSWYDGLMLLPTWRWLRTVPVAVRLHKSGLINLERILAQVTHEPAAYLADRVGMFLMVRLINQTQEAVETGEAAKMLLQPGDYIQVSDVDKVDAILDRILQIAIYKAVPQVQPELESLLHHSLKGAFKSSDFYQALQQVPGLSALPQEATEQLADYLSQAAYEVLATSYGDVQGRELFENLTANFKQVLRRELQDEKTQAELQSLLADLLEEVKLNYIQGAKKQDPEATLAEAEKLRNRLEKEI
ncbi:MAG: hypothetical protein WBG70_17295 [Spirulinaceae cyanobacterium]